MRFCNRILSGLLVWGFFSSALCARPNELFISEYIEGSSNNKALEIFNGTGAEISLDGYVISTSFNGGSTVKNIPLSGTISDGSVYVLAHKKASQAILNEADDLVPVTWFNGDDAIVLLKNDIVVDVFGVVGIDPGTQWGSSITGTKDHTLRRKPDVFSGDNNDSDEFIPSIEWEGFDKDDFTGLGKHSITLINNPPVIKGTPSISVNQGQAYNFIPDASDSDGDSLTFSIENKPGWVVFDMNTGHLSGTPVDSDVGIYPGVKILVSDGQGGNDFLEPFTITVVNINDAPVIDGLPIKSIKQDEQYNFTPTSSDADGDTLIFSVSNLPVWAVLNPATGQLSGIPDNDDVGVYSQIEIFVSDGEGGISSLEPFDINVINVNDPPTIVATPKLSVKQDDLYEMLPLASDIDGDKLMFSIINKPEWAVFDVLTGMLMGTPRNANTGEYGKITISVSDGQGGVASLPVFSILVTNINDAPLLLGGLPEKEARAGEAYGYTPNFVDPDGDRLNFSIVNLPAWASFDSATGTLNGIPEKSDRGIYDDIFITASDPDGGSISTVPFRIVVLDYNRAPTFDIGSDQVVYKNSGRHMIAGWAKNISDGDFDTQELRFEIIENTNPDLFAGLFVAKPDISVSTGALFFRPALHAEGVATLTVVLKDDGGISYGGTDVSEPQQFTITVDPSQDLGAGELFNPGSFQFNDIELVSSEITNLTNLSLELGFSSFDQVDNVSDSLGGFDYTPPLEGLNRIEPVVFELGDTELSVPSPSGESHSEEIVIINANIFNRGDDAGENVRLHLLIHGDGEVIGYDSRCLPGTSGSQISCQLRNDPKEITVLQFAVSIKESTGIFAEAEIVASNDKEFRDNSAQLFFEDREGDTAANQTSGGGGFGLWVLLLMLGAKFRYGNIVSVKF